MPLPAAAVSAGTGAAPPQDDAASRRFGRGVDTRVQMIGSRLEGMPDSGPRVMHRKGLGQASGQVAVEIVVSRPRDAVRLWPAGLPHRFPHGDRRGRVNRAENPRKHATWRAADSEHECGAA